MCILSGWERARLIWPETAAEWKSDTTGSSAEQMDMKGELCHFLQISKTERYCMLPTMSLWVASHRENVINSVLSGWSAWWTLSFNGDSVDMGHWINKLNYVFCCDWCDQIDRCLAGEDCLELHANPALCAACVSATQASARMCECPPIAGFGWCSEPGSSVSPSSKVSSSSQEKQDIYTKMPVIVLHTHTQSSKRTHRVTQYLHWQSRAERRPLKNACPNLFPADVFP